MARVHSWLRSIASNSTLAALCRAEAMADSRSFAIIIRLTVRVREMKLFNQYRAAISEERAREAGPPWREGHWAPAEGRQRVLAGLPRETAGTGGASKVTDVAEAGVHWRVQCAQ